MSNSSDNHADGELPLDFLAFLQQRLGVTSDLALATLADWVGSYEPVKRRAQVGSADCRANNLPMPLVA
jgi:hypothetical protein